MYLKYYTSKGKRMCELIVNFCDFKNIKHKKQIKFIEEMNSQKSERK